MKKEGIETLVAPERRPVPPPMRNIGTIAYVRAGDIKCTCGSDKFTLTAETGGVDITCANCQAFLSMTW